MAKAAKVGGAGRGTTTRRRIKKVCEAFERHMADYGLTSEDMFFTRCVFNCLGGREEK